jgi:hypothetical protein
MTQPTTDPIVKELKRSERDFLYQVLIVQKTEMEFHLNVATTVTGYKHDIENYTVRLAEVEKALALF